MTYPKNIQKQIDEENSKISWKPTIEQWGELTKEEIYFLFNQAEKRLKESTEAAVRLNNNLTVVLTLVAGLFISLTAYAIANITVIDYKAWAIMISDAYLFLQAGYIIVFNMRGFKYHVIGNEPAPLSYSLDFSKAKHEEREIYLIMAEMSAYQERLIINRVLNKLRTIRFRASLYMILLTPVIMGIILAITNYLHQVTQ